jgi:TolA-binding protein
MGFRRRWLLILFAFVLGGGPLFAATKEQSAYAAAVAAFQTQDWGRAETQLAQFRQKYPASTNAPEAVLLQAQAAFKQGKLAETIALLADSSRLAKAGPLADQYVYWTGEAQFQNGRLADAAATFVSLVRNFSTSPLRLRAVLEAAAAYARLGDWPRHDALLEAPDSVFQQAARWDPGNELVADGQLSLENSKFQQRDFPAVLAVYERLTNHWQTLNQIQQCQATYMRYRAKMELGDLAAALAAATDLVEIAGTPTNQDWLAAGWSAQGATLEQMNHLPDAIQAWKNNLTNAPARQKWEAIWKIAELEIVQGELTNAGETLTNFLGQFKEADAADIALLTAGELHLKNHAAEPGKTNQLSAARDCFDRFLLTFTNSPLAGKAYLDRGWCHWLAGDPTNSLADFAAAAQRLPPSEDLAVARFKMGDVLLALTNYAGALENYRAVLDDFTNFPAVGGALGGQALYQSLRASLAMTNLAGASDALEQILKQYPGSRLASGSKLLYGEGLADARQPAAAREVFQQFLAQFPDSPLRPDAAFALARTYELEQNWPAAIAGYQHWLEDFPTNQTRSQTLYALAQAYSRAGNQTNAFKLFTEFVTEFPASDLAPRVQWWLADYFFNLGGSRSPTNYVDAERSYKLLYQNTNWQGSPLIYPARLMAGKASVARQEFNGAINNYFKPLEADTNCPVDLRLQAVFAHGNALMQMDWPDTNNPLANFSAATNVFVQIIQVNPTGELALRAWCKIGDCNFQLGNYDAATNAYAQVVNATNADVSARSEAQFKIGTTLEKMAALTGADQTAVLAAARDQYLDVFDTWTGENLRTGETADPIWVKRAGSQALLLIKALGTADPNRFIDQMEKLFPQSKDSLEKTRATLLSQKN